MKKLICLCLSLYFTSASAANYTTGWVTQSQDHFDVQNTNTWLQRYFVNDEFFNQTNRSVAFLFVEGDSEAYDLWMTNGDWYEYAQQYNAILFELEHRFYGESRPTKDVSVESLKYLSSQQAIADLAVFVDAMNKEYNLSKEVKWIAFGASYSGTLAAYFRLKYPHLVAGAVAASASLLNVANFPEYFEDVAQVIKETDPKCLSALQAGTAQIEALTQNSAGAKTLTSSFQLCTPLEDVIGNKDEIINFFSTLADSFAVTVQFNNDNRLSTRNTPLANITIDTLCDIMTDVSKPEIDRLAAVNSLMLNASEQTCVDYSYSTRVNDFANETWEAAGGGRQQFYQYCTEFGLFQTATKNLGFGDIPFDWYIKQCADFFGPQFNETYLNRGLEKAKIFYGGLNIEVSRVVFTQGSKDPWRRSGLTKTRSNKAPVIYIKGTAHSATMYPSSDKDLPQLTAARQKVGRLIGSWLNHH